MTVLDDAMPAEADALDVEDSVSAVEIGPVRLAALWAFVGAGVAAGAAVVVAEAFAADMDGGVMALGLILVAAAALLGLVLCVRQLLPAQRIAATHDGTSDPVRPGELRDEAVLAFWIFGGAGVIAGGTAVFLSASALSSSVLILSGLACLVMAAARRLPRGW